MKKLTRILACCILSSTLLTPPVIMAHPPIKKAENTSALLQSLAKQINLPWQSFTLPNGLRVLVHTDHKAPVVGVSVWYHVGSKDEPKGKTGFAHLFEHLMFEGSQNIQGSFWKPLRETGATDSNGTTNFDRTNYYETVPTSALDRVLYMESDRMGYLLQGMTQEKLDNQRAVVQNEKRQKDNRPYSAVGYAITQALVPEGHPYHHDTIGSMEDLDAASLDTVKDWFRENYGPNNAVLVLAGDIDIDKAKTMVNHYFGAIPRGRDIVHPETPIWTLPTRKDEVITDKVALSKIYRAWSIPSYNNPDSIPLDLSAAVLGGLASSRLDQILVHQEQLAVNVSATTQSFEGQGRFLVSVTVKPGVNPQYVSQRLDKILAEYLEKGATQDEVNRAAMDVLSDSVAESVSAQGPILAQGLLYAKDPDYYKKALYAVATSTAEEVQKSTQKWLSRPVYALTVLPGARQAYQESQSGKSTPKADNNLILPIAPQPAASEIASSREALPAVGKVPDVRFPTITHSQLKNGIAVSYAQRPAVPLTTVLISFDGGITADTALPGTESLMLSMLTEGTKEKDVIELSKEKERLGAVISFGAGDDYSSMTFLSPSVTFRQTTGLASEMLFGSTFPEKELARLKASTLANMAASRQSPAWLATRALRQNLYGEGHPYRHLVTEENIQKITRQHLLDFRQKWIRPYKAHIFIVSDQSLDQILPVLNTVFGHWQIPNDAGELKPTSTAKAGHLSDILLINRPQSPQSVIMAASVLPLKEKEDQNTLFNLDVANSILGGNFLSRLNMDLRQNKGWSYGVGSQINARTLSSEFSLAAPVQTNQTAASINAIQEDINYFLTDKGISDAELRETVTGIINRTPAAYEKSSNILGGMVDLALMNRPDNYYDTLNQRYRALTPSELDKTARQWLSSQALSWVVVGDANLVKPQLEKRGLSVEQVESDKIK
ncbi:putative Zn-dependent peptidase [Zymomonas mobilis]|uniref:M16 family metallopeptidase n=1 Tax=Zymomonas mobilis TaxID=542 RepID=UPI00026D805C|nr:pitrilysin family protein [Zymomonas mobilis]AFN57516.1 peptidase M16 domain protein [Zymomonas mobilis subsp. mobilis ATCC 29191]TQK78717.1 putative Zn-dependent peptidase [Zymomonas mobilis]TQL16078.1 putative Zn-dependent peptidase [Zymomonas mobilis]GEB86888.1 zinc protease [Zymomonas mobilis subsp. mobilis]